MNEPRQRKKRPRKATSGKAAASPESSVSAGPTQPELRHLRQLRTLSALAGEIAQLRSPEEFFPGLVETLRAEFGYAHASVFLTDVPAGEVVLEAITTVEVAPFRSGYRQPLDVGIVGLVARTGEAYIAQDTSRDEYFHEVDGNGLNPRRAELAVPIRAEGKTVGVLNIESNEPDAFDETDIDIVRALGDLISVALENGRLVEDARRAERQKLHAEKLATIGQLVAGLAHEINNPLAAVQSGVELLLSEDPADGTRQVLQVVRAEASRASTIVKNLLDFARPRDVEAHEVSVPDVLEATLSLRSYELALQNITVAVDLPQLPPVRGDRYRLQQVLLNLIVNAEQAMAAQPAARSLTIDGSVAGDEVELRFRDSGPGIPPDQLEKIFDPFFTTKAVGEGTGLGLTVSFGILRDLGGRIWAESAPGQGATFVVRIPTAARVAATTTRTADPATIADADADASPPLSPSILFVDDEASIRQMAARYLRRIGYTVELAGDGEEALRLLQARHFDVIVTDLKMPGIGGEDLYRRLEELQLSLQDRFLFISGDIMGDKTRSFLSKTGRPYLTKPFELKELARRVQEVATQARS